MKFIALISICLAVVAFAADPSVQKTKFARVEKSTEPLVASPTFIQKYKAIIAASVVGVAGLAAGGALFLKKRNGKVENQIKAYTKVTEKYFADLDKFITDSKAVEEAKYNVDEKEDALEKLSDKWTDKMENHKNNVKEAKEAIHKTLKLQNRASAKAVRQAKKKWSDEKYADKLKKAVNDLTKKADEIKEIEEKFDEEEAKANKKADEKFKAAAFDIRDFASFQL